MRHGDTKVKLPLGLKLIAVITIIEGLGFVLLNFVVPKLGWFEVVLGTVGIATGIGLVLRRKWAWLLAVAITGLNILLDLMTLPFLPMFYEKVVRRLGVQSVYLCVSIGDYVYLGFCAYYLTRPRVRALFHVGTAKASA